jgi:hypothetical protein
VVLLGGGAFGRVCWGLGFVFIVAYLFIRFLEIETKNEVHFPL